MLQFIIGLFVGAFAAVFALMLCSAGRDDEENSDKF